MYGRMYGVLKFARVHLRALVRDEKAATAIEYGMIAALIAAVIIGVITAIGTNLETAFETIKDGISKADEGADP